MKNEGKGVAIFLDLKNIIGYAIVPVNIGRTVYGKSVVFRQLLAPFLLVAVDSPIIAIESAPENCFSVLS